MALKNFSVTQGYDSQKLAGNLDFMAKSISKADTYTLTDADRQAQVLRVTLSAASKAIVGGYETGKCVIINNAGATNAFTFKNLADDSGTSIGTGKVALVIASKTANSTVVYVLN